VPQKSSKVDILPISIYLVVVLYRHKHCRPQKVELDLACRDSTTTKNNIISYHIRLWSDPQDTSWREAEQRLLEQRRRMAFERGIHADAIQPEFCRYN
jgi:hypothetical protein